VPKGIIPVRRASLARPANSQGTPVCSQGDGNNREASRCVFLSRVSVSEKWRGHITGVRARVRGRQRERLWHSGTEGRTDSKSSWDWSVVGLMVGVGCLFFCIILSSSCLASHPGIILGLPFLVPTLPSPRDLRASPDPQGQLLLVYLHPCTNSPLGSQPLAVGPSAQS